MRSKGSAAKGLLIALTLSLIPTPAMSAQKITAGSKCKVYKQKVNYQNKTYTCMKSGNKLIWKKAKLVATPTPTITPSPGPSSVATKNIVYSPPLVLGDNIELCKIKQVINSRAMMENELLTGFLKPNFKFATKMGTVKWALIPIDFPDLRGEKEFRSRVDNQMKLLSEWYATVSENKFKIEWVILDKWVTLSNVSTDYVIPLSANLNNAPNGHKLFKDAMDAADPVFDFSNIQTVNFILPKGQTFLGETSQGFPWDQPVINYTSKEGKIASYSIPGVYLDLPGKEYWSYWAHEFGHAAGIPHVGASRGITPPFNPWDLMGGSDGPSRELSGWLRFLANWLPDEKVYCKEATNIKSVELTLVPLSGEEPGLKLVVIPLSKTKAILIESRRVTKFSCTTPTLRNGPLVYIYDATLGHNEDFLVPVYLSSKPVERTSDCVTALTINAVFAEGEKITVEGITIEVLASRNFDKLVISKSE